MLVGGALTEELGVRTLLIAIAAVYITATVSLIFIPILRDMDRGSRAAGTAAASQAGPAVGAADGRARQGSVGLRNGRREQA